VCGAPIFLDADHSLVGFEENFSRKPGRFSRFRGEFQDVVSQIAMADDFSQLNNGVSMA
jgi:hypothetical protein